MTYNAKTNWKFDTPVTEDDFNRIEQGVKDAHEKTESIDAELGIHESKRNNPHNVNKEQVGLSNVDNVKQAPKTEFDTHKNDETKHITTSERSSWNNKETPSGAQAKATKAKDDAVAWVKDFGLGTVASDISNTDLNDLNASGFYEGNPVDNNPEGETSDRRFQVIHIEHASYALQIASRATSELTWLRYKKNGKWTEWSEIETAAGSQAKVNAHANLTDNPHNVTKAQIGLGSVQNYGIATKEEAESGTINTGYMTPLRTKEATNYYMRNTTAVRLGINSNVANVYAVAIGRDSYADSSAISIGYNANAGEFNSIAIGTGAVSDYDYSTAIGRGAVASGYYSVALGEGANALNTDDCVLGTSPREWRVPGSFTVNGTKNFEMPHPKPEKSATHVIRHSAVESPTAGDNLYRFTVTSTKDGDIQYIDLPDYFVHLNKDVQIFVTPQRHFGNGYGVLNNETEQLEISCQHEGEYNVLVIGTRNDNHQSVQDWDIKGVEREIGESWTGETYAFEVDEIMEVDEIREEA